MSYVAVKLSFTIEANFQISNFPSQLAAEIRQCNILGMLPIITNSRHILWLNSEHKFIRTSNHNLLPKTNDNFSCVVEHNWYLSLPTQIKLLPFSS